MRREASKTGEGSPGRLDGKVAIVTGGASGIGRATWLRFLEEGARVVVADRDPSIAGEVAAAGADGTFVGLDVRNPAGWAALVEASKRLFGRLDILVNCAGILREGTVEDTSLAEWREVIDVNLTGTFLGCQAVASLMRDSGGGSIVNLSSVSGLKGDAGLLAYDASKGGVAALTRDVALYFARRGEAIRCNSVHPNVVATDMVTGFFKTAKLQKLEEWMESQPSGRMIEPEEIAAAILFLASDESRYVNGSEFVVDCGATA
jgi:NAD(P)-dependent dehydrogenase (short-subunit alcohol dehydrogenase family)